MSKKAKKKKPAAFEGSLIASNKKARRDYHISDTYEAGIVLKGTEVKSIRDGKINLADSYCRIDKGEAWLYNCDIRPYEAASHYIHDPRANRRLLLHKKEILKMQALTDQRGASIVALRAYWKNRRVKIELGIGKGKTHNDQRDDIKKRVQTREAEREMARFNRR